MAILTSQGARRRGGRTQVRLVGCCVLLPVLLIGAAAILFYVNNHHFDIDVPTPQLPNPNAYDDFVRAGNLARAMKHISPISMPHPSFAFADFEAAAKDAQPALAATRQGFGKECLNPAAASRNPLARSFPELATFRELARTGSGVAVYHDMNGEAAQATEARLDALEMGVMIPRGGMLIGGLVGAACEAIAVQAFEAQLPFLSEAELAHVGSRLERIALKRVSYADILDDEGYAQAASDASLMNDPNGYGSFGAVRDLLAEDDPAAPVPGTSKPLTLHQDWQALSFMFADKEAIVRQNQAYMKALAAEARGPYRVRSAVPVPKNLLAQIRGDAFAQSRGRFVAIEAVLAILRTDVALLRYKKAHGRFPDGLAALLPGHVRPDAINDPFTRAPLRYRPLSNGRAYLLYSVGPDLVDDGGTPSRHVTTGPGDIVAGRMWPRKRTYPRRVKK